MAVSLIVAALTYHRAEGPALSDDLPTPGATGTDGGLNAPGTSTGSAILAAPGRYEPSRQLWLELLPRLESALQAGPDDVNLKRKLAITYYNLGMLKEAAAIYEALLAVKDDPVLRNRLGNTMRDMGDIASAEAHYRTAIAADPQLAAAYLNLAELLWRQGRDEESLAVIDEGLKRVPEDRRGPLEAGRAALERPSG